MRAVIFSSAEISDYEYLRQYDISGQMIICADAGLKHAIKLGLKPDIVLGDNDSFACEIPEGIKRIIYPPE